MPARQFDVLVLGGGAAGLMCAAVAAARGRRVGLIEGNERVGRKIEISGGGRCNFTNLHASPDNYLSENPHFCRSALARYTPDDFLALLAGHDIGWNEKKLGQLFCNDGSKRIIAMLVEECRRAGVETICSARIESVEKPEHFRVVTAQGELTAESVVVATGGLSFAKLGASDIGYRIARRFGLRVTETRPGLVPVTLEAAELARFGPLSGLAVETVARHGVASFPEATLFTHRGLSGPAILQISSHWRAGETFQLDLLPGLPGDVVFRAARRSSRTPAQMLADHWPRRFLDAWCAGDVAEKPLAQWSDAALEALIARLHGWPITPTGTEGFPKAEVTLGGVDTRALSSKTMEAREVPGLFFIGEVVDVTGWLGGYNFQWAWASAQAAGEVV